MERPKKKTGRTLLTPETASQLEVLWQLSGDDTLTDLEIAERLSIPFLRLKSWLRRNMKPRDAEGQQGPDGLREIRTRAKATTKSSYLQRLYKLMVDAENAKDYRTAINTLQWLLEKQFPNQFGNRLKLSGQLDTGRDLESLTDKELKEEIEKDISELMKRPECREALKKHSSLLSVSS